MPIWCQATFWKFQTDPFCPLIMPGYVARIQKKSFKVDPEIPNWEFWSKIGPNFPFAPKQGFSGKLQKCQFWPLMTPSFTAMFQKKSWERLFKLCNLTPKQTQTAHLTPRGTFLEILNKSNMFSYNTKKILQVDPEISNCVILAQNATKLPICPQNGEFLGNNQHAIFSLL